MHLQYYYYGIICYDGRFISLAEQRWIWSRKMICMGWSAAYQLQYVMLVAGNSTSLIYIRAKCFLFPFPFRCPAFHSSKTKLKIFSFALSYSSSSWIHREIFDGKEGWMAWSSAWTGMLKWVLRSSTFRSNSTPFLYSCKLKHFLDYKTYLDHALIFFSQIF